MDGVTTQSFLSLGPLVFLRSQVNSLSSLVATVLPGCYSCPHDSCSNVCSDPDWVSGLSVTASAQLSPQSDS